MAKYKIGDSVWFKFDNGKKEQKGVIQWHGDICGYQILGNVDSKVYFVKEEEISGIAPHKRLLDNEKKCSNCYHFDKSGGEYPCCHCDSTNSSWEPKVKNVEPNNDTPCCSKCKFHDRGVDQWPCDNCRDYSQFESAVKKVDYRSFYPVTTGLSSPIYDDMKKKISTKLASEQMWGIAKSTKLLGLNVNEIYFDDILKEDKPMNKKMVVTAVTYKREIKDIIFSGPATIVRFNNQFDKEEKAVVKCSENDTFDKTKGFLLALIKEFMDKKSWNNILRIIDGFEEPEAETETSKDVKEKDIITDDISKAIIEKLRDEYVPEQKFYMLDIVTFKSKGSHHYTVDNYRWNAEHKCWEYRIYNHVSYRWYEESRLVLVSRAININDIVRINGSLFMHRVVDKNWNSVKGQHEYTLVQVGDPIETKITRLYSDLRKLYDSSSKIAKDFRKVD